MAETRRALPDRDSRRRAATDFHTNLVVLAGAGTGKTSLLVERALNAIGSGRASISEIAAITFTEKAAGEMRERLAQGLDRLRALARGEAEVDEAREADRAYRHLTGELRADPGAVARRALAAMEAVDQGTVMTIHRFCSELLRSFPFEAGVDPNFAVDSGEQFESLCERHWEAFLERELGPEGRRPEQWKRVLSRVSLAEVAAVARGLADFGVPQALLRERAPALGAREVFSEEASRIIAEIDSLMRRQSGMAGVAERYFPAVRSALEALRAEGLGAMQERIPSGSELACRLESSSRLPQANKKLRGVSGEELERIARDARDLLRPLSLADDELIRDLVAIVSPFALKFREQYLSHGLVSFDGLLALTRDLLRDRPEVRQKLKRGYRLLLVDEFQDTDPLQYEIVLFLAEGTDDDHADAFLARLHPGRLFVVGDAKQSIYRFRGADYDAYRSATERIVEAGGQTLDLTGNFRSVPGVIDPVNRLFTGHDGSWEDSSQQPPYVPIDAVRGDSDERPRVELWTVDLPPGARAEQRREAEGRVVAEAIERWFREQRVAYERITILFRAFTNITHYLRPLRERGIPFVVDGGKEFLERPEVGQLMATLRTLSQPSNEPALLAFLRSPAGGVSDVELAAYADAGGRWSWRADAGRFPNIARSFALLKQLRLETRELPVDAMVRRVLDRTRLLPLGAAAFEGPQRVANLQKLAASAGDLAREGSLSLEQVVEALEQGRLEDIRTDRPLADDAARAVRITSIHRMKGLENDVILLPDLAREEWSRETEPAAIKLTRLPDGRLDLGVIAGGIRSSSRVWFDREEKLHGRAEEVRVLYVAVTRARERLVVLAGPSRGNAPWVEALAPWGYDAAHPPEDHRPLCDGRVLHRLLQPPARRRPPKTRVPEAATQAVRRYAEAAESLRAASKPPVAVPSGLHEEREGRLAADREALPRRLRVAREVGQAAGIVLHRLLECWEGGDERAWREKLEALCVETARETRIELSELKTEAAEILDAFLATDLPGRFLEVERLGREVPVLVRHESGQVLRGSIDLLYREGDEITIADYKTDRNTDEADLRRSYRDQLAVYGDAVRQAFELPRMPRAELWLLRTGKVLTLGGSSGPVGGPDKPKQTRLW